MAILLSDLERLEEPVDDEELCFPSETEIMTILQARQDDSTEYENEAGNTPDIVLNEPCIVLWDEGKTRNWYVGISISKEGDAYLVDHLERVPRHQSKECWQYPSSPDLQLVELIQIVPCNVIGSWDLTRPKSIFKLSNWDIIEGLVKSMYSTN